MNTKKLNYLIFLILTILTMAFLNGIAHAVLVSGWQPAEGKMVTLTFSDEAGNTIVGKIQKAIFWELGTENDPNFVAWDYTATFFIKAKDGKEHTIPNTEVKNRIKNVYRNFSPAGIIRGDVMELVKSVAQKPTPEGQETQNTIRTLRAFDLTFVREVRSTIADPIYSIRILGYPNSIFHERILPDGSKVMIAEVTDSFQPKWVTSDLFSNYTDSFLESGILVVGFNPSFDPCIHGIDVAFKTKGEITWNGYHMIAKENGEQLVFVKKLKWQSKSEPWRLSGIMYGLDIPELTKVQESGWIQSIIQGTINLDSKVEKSNGVLKASGTKIIHIIHGNQKYVLKFLPDCIFELGKDPLLGKVTIDQLLEFRQGQQYQFTVRGYVGKEIFVLGFPEYIKTLEVFYLERMLESKKEGESSDPNDTGREANQVHSNMMQNPQQIIPQREDVRAPQTKEIKSSHKTQKNDATIISGTSVKPESLLPKIDEGELPSLNPAQKVKVVVKYQGDGIDMAPLFDHYMRTILYGMDVKLAGPNEQDNADIAVILIDIHAKAISTVYSRRGKAYTGASMNVKVSIQSPQGSQVNVDIEHKIDPPYIITIPDMPYYSKSKPSNAPFDRIFWPIQKQLLYLLGRIYGSDRLLLLHNKLEANEIRLDHKVCEAFDKQWKAAGNVMSFPYETFFLSSILCDVLKEQRLIQDTEH